MAANVADGTDTADKGHAIDKAIETVFAAADIPGLDIADGAARFNGNNRIYLNVIHSFTKTMPDSLLDLQNVDEGSLGEYAVRVHGIKSSCYGIGAVQTGDMAKSLEIAAKNGAWQAVKDKNPHFIETMRSLVGNLMQLYDTAQHEIRQNTQARPRATKPNSETLNELVGATREYDIEGMRDAMHKLDEFDYDEDEDLIIWLKEKIDAFSYDDIIERLAE
jgi:HPt (histidine-containing phosphotransfer) domain-containing protein